MQPRGIRNNNPGNIERGAPWQGLAKPADMTPEQRAETRFAVFKSPVWGIRAIARVIITYYDRRKAKDGSPIDTVKEVIERWAPSHENDTNAYVAFIRRQLGMDPGRTATINAHEYRFMRPMVEAIIMFENGMQPYSDDEIDRGLALAGIEPPVLKTEREKRRKVMETGTGKSAALGLGGLLAGAAANADQVVGVATNPAVQAVVENLEYIGWFVGALIALALVLMLVRKTNMEREKEV